MKTAHVVNYYESQAKVARALGISESAVSRWGDVVPIARAVEIQALTDGALMVNVNDYLERKGK